MKHAATMTLPRLDLGRLATLVLAVVAVGGATSLAAAGPSWAAQYAATGVWSAIYLMLTSAAIKGLFGGNAVSGMMMVMMKFAVMGLSLAFLFTPAAEAIAWRPWALALGVLTPLAVMIPFFLRSVNMAREPELGEESR